MKLPLLFIALCGGSVGGRAAAKIADGFPDPCSLVTLAEVGRVVPSPLPGKFSQIDTSLGFGDIRECTWHGRGGASITFRVSIPDEDLRDFIQLSIDGLDETHDRRPAKIERVSGVGEEAWALIAPNVYNSRDLPDLAQVSVRARGYELDIYTYDLGRSGHAAALEGLMELAQAAIVRLP